MKYINTNKKEKLDINTKNISIITDFDKTITAKNSMDSWDASGKELNENFHKEMDEIYKIYYPIELDYTIGFEEKEQKMIEWYGKCMDLYYKYDLTKEKLEKSVRKSDLILRNGAKELLKKANDMQIPVIILSAGIGNVIEIFLKDNNLFTDNIYIISNFIKFDENGKMKKFTDKMIHSLNKKLDGNLPEKWKEEIRKRKYKVLFGDLIEDVNAIEDEDLQNTLTIGFLNSKEKENLESYNKRFDVVLTGEDARFFMCC